jgi:hypothetical protein
MKYKNILIFFLDNVGWKREKGCGKQNGFSDLESGTRIFESGTRSLDLGALR